MPFHEKRDDLWMEFAKCLLWKRGHLFPAWIFKSVFSQPFDCVALWGLWSALGGNTVSLRGSPALLDATSQLDSVCDSPGLEDSQQTQEWLLALWCPCDLFRSR